MLVTTEMWSFKANLPIIPKLCYFEILCQGHMMPHSYVHTAMQPLYTTEQGIIGDVVAL